MSDLQHKTCTFQRTQNTSKEEKTLLCRVSIKLVILQLRLRFYVFYFCFLHEPGKNRVYASRGYAYNKRVFSVHKYRPSLEYAVISLNDP